MGSGKLGLQDHASINNLSHALQVQLTMMSGPAKLRLTDDTAGAENLRDRLQAILNKK